MTLSLPERAPLYSLFSLLLLAELDEESRAVLAEPVVAEVFERAGPGTEAWLREPWTQARERRAREEFARLFLLPGGAPPFASAWIDGPLEALGGQLATLMSRALEALGREPLEREPWGRLPLDHAGLLFDVVSSAMATGDAEAVAVAAHLDRELLGDWVGRFGAALASRAELPVYVALGRILEEVHPPADADA